MNRTHFFIIETPRIAGGEGLGENVDTIFDFDTEAETWSEVGHMAMPRGGHAVSVVNFSDFAPWCN